MEFVYSLGYKVFSDNLSSIELNRPAKLLSTINEVLLQDNTASGVLGMIGKGSMAVVTRNALKMMQMLIDVEMRMFTLASGAIPAREAYEFINKQKIQSVVFGASSRNHIEETVELITI